MSIIDQSEIDELLAEADGLAAEAAEQLDEEAPPPPPPPRKSLRITDPNIARLLKIRVPVVVQLASRPMSISTIRDFSVGAIIEFDKNVEEPLELLVRDRRIGQGTCVKVGENFGFRVAQICDKAQRLRSMGGRADEC